MEKSAWDHLGETANVSQLRGLDAVSLIGVIVKAASTARMLKKNCRQFARDLELIGNLLEQLKISRLMENPVTREPLEQLEDALRRSYILVNRCQDRSYLYRLILGWYIVNQFRNVQGEIDRYLRLVPLIALVVDDERVKRFPFLRKDGKKGDRGRFLFLQRFPFLRKDGKKGDRGKEKEKKGGEDKKKKPKEPAMTTAFLKIQLHCDCCIHKIRRNIYKIKGVQQATIDITNGLVTVKGTMDVKALSDFLKEKLKRNVEIVPPKERRWVWGQ